MGSATEWPILVRDAVSGFCLEQRAAAVLFGGEFVYAALLQGARGDERLTSGKVGCFARELELTALGAPRAVSFHGAFFKLCVHGFDRFHGFLLADEFAVRFAHWIKEEFRLEPFFATEIKQLEQCDCHHDRDADGVAVGVPQFRHVPGEGMALGFGLKIHAPDSG